MYSERFMELHHIRERHRAALQRFDFFTNIAAMYSCVMNSLSVLLAISREDNPELNPAVQTIQLRKAMCIRMVEQLANIVPFSIQACHIYQTIRSYYGVMLQTEVSPVHSYLENIMTVDHVRAWRMIFLSTVQDVNLQFEVSRACLETAENQLTSIVDEMQYILYGHSDTELDSGDSD